ncbi:MAG: prepilin-type N-terminal cleavage/methylation domain-containing protein [Rubrivivax sp.]|nr:prepilin-type N-terminal cleavage/methylation domain-containing protein [Rubrivivax sp.]
MRATSGCCQLRAEKLGRRRAAHAGFTLLEMLVVLALIALLGAVVLPALSSGLDKARARAFERDLKAVVDALPLRAFLRGEPLEVDASALLAALPPDQPAGYSVSLGQPLRYGADGVAAGGELLLSRPDGRNQRWTVLPITGQAQPVDTRDALP